MFDLTKSIRVQDRSMSQYRGASFCDEDVREGLGTKTTSRTICGFAIETVEQEGNNMCSFHLELSYPLRYFFKAFFQREILCPSFVKRLRDRTTILLSEGDLK